MSSGFGSSESGRPRDGHRIFVTFVARGWARFGEDVRHHAGAIAITRSGLPLPPTIFSGAAMTIDPVGGS